MSKQPPTSVQLEQHVKALLLESENDKKRSDDVCSLQENDWGGGWGV